MLISATSLAHSPLSKLIDDLFGWPSVLLLLYFSVDYPSYYWGEHAAAMRVVLEQTESKE
jgi:hypothetical protein